MTTTPATLDEVLAALFQMQQENQDLRTSLAQMQQAAPTGHAAHTYAPEPKISLPQKFDGTTQLYRGFVNQVKLILQLHPRRYPNDQAKVGLIGTLLTGTALSWFSPLIETNSHLLHDFSGFLMELEATFGNADKARTSATKIRALLQGSKPAATYASEFRLLACDLNWGESALINQFQIGLRENVKDLLLTLSDPQSLSEAIQQAIRCDNRLYERRQQSRTLQSFRYPSQFTSNRYPPNSQPTTSLDIANDPMQIDMLRHKKLSPEEKLRRQKENLCLYCGEPGHIARMCPKKTQPYQVHYSNTQQEMSKESENSNVQLQ